MLSKCSFSGFSNSYAQKHRANSEQLYLHTNFGIKINYNTPVLSRMALECDPMKLMNEEIEIAKQKTNLIQNTAEKFVN